jgi:hypothetical protein
MTVFKSSRPFWKRFIQQAVVISGLFVVQPGALLLTGKTDFDIRWLLILLILLVSFLFDHVNKVNIESISFDTDDGQIVLEFFSLFTKNKKVTVPFEKLSLTCYHEGKQSELFIHGFSSSPVVLDGKWRGFTNEQIAGMQTLIWSLNLPIETKGSQLSVRNY